MTPEIQEELKEKLQGKSLCIAVPSYDGNVNVHTAMSIAKTNEVLGRLNVPVSWLSKSGCCYIDRTRDVLVHGFLKSTPSTDFLTIDTDVAFKPKDVLSLLMWDVDIRCGMYPLKDRKETRYTVRFWPREDERFTFRGPLIQAQMVPFGFLMCSRNALQHMTDYFKDLTYCYNANTSYEGPGPRELDRCVALHHMMYEDNEIWGEDYAFCKRWIESGGDGVWIDTTIDIAHYMGLEKYEGSFIKWCEENSRPIEPSSSVA